MLDKIISLIDEIKVNKQNGKIAVYKPLLLLIVFRDVLKGKENRFTFNETNEELERLMEKYGWNTKARKRPQYPFYFLASSSLWEINIDTSRLKNPDAPSKAELTNAVGHLNHDLYSYLVKDRKATQSVINHINEKFFNGEFEF